MVAAVALSLAVACARATSAPSGLPPVSPPRPVPPAPIVDAPRRVAVGPVSAPARYDIETHAVLRAQADSLTRTDTAVTRASLTVIPRGAALDVTLRSYVVTPVGALPTQLPAAARALGRFDASGAIAFDGAGLSDCGSAQRAAFDATRDVWVRWPDSVAVGDRWRDSTSASMCRDGVPLQLVLVRTYVVTSIDGADTARRVKIDRRSALSLTGQGTLRGEATDIRGEGSGVATLWLAPATGWLIEGEATSTMQLDARSGTRVQHVEQQVRTTFRHAQDSAGGVPRGR